MLFINILIVIYENICHKLCITTLYTQFEDKTKLKNITKKNKNYTL